MSRYIDTEWLENNAKEYSLGYYEADEWATPLSVLDSAPSIDIVRCGECKHWWNEYGDSACMLHSDFTVNADDFCSYGSRSEKPNNCEDEQMETQTETQNSNLTFEKVMEEIQTQVIEFPDTHQKFTFARKIEMDGDSIKIGGWEYKGVKDGEREGE